MAFLVLIRHGESTWNKEAKWTGRQNPPLTETGIQQARQAAHAIQDIQITAAYTSPLLRVTQTLSTIKEELHQDFPITETDGLLERNYGDYTGMNKWEMKEKWGEEKFMNVRRGWDEPIPNGESLKDVYHRVIPFYKTTILPQLQAGKNILITSHGNCIRALMKYVENISDEDIPNHEIGTGQVKVYTIQPDGSLANVETRTESKAP